MTRAGEIHALAEAGGYPDDVLSVEELLAYRHWRTAARELLAQNILVVPLQNKLQAAVTRAGKGEQCGAEIDAINAELAPLKTSHAEAALAFRETLQALTNIVAPPVE